MVNLYYIMLAIAACLTLMVSTVISTKTVAKKSNRMSYVAYAISEIVQNLSEKNVKNFDVEIYGYNIQLHFLAQEIVKKIANGTHSVTLKQKSHNEKFSAWCGQTPKIILAAQELEVDADENDTSRFYAYHDAVMIFYYLDESNMTVYAKTFGKLTGDIKSRALFISHTTDRNSNNLKLYGYDKYSTCTNAFNLRLRNIFVASSMKWIHQTFQHDYKNFNGCPLNVVMLHTIQCNVGLKRRKNRKGGYDYDIIDPNDQLLQLYAEKHNARIQIEEEQLPDGGILRTDLVLFPTEMFETLPKDLFTSTVAIDDYQIAFIVTRGREFTPFEKLILPFDSATWYLNLSTVLAGYLVIFILYQMPTYLQKFVFGTSNRNPSMELSQIFFGIGLTQTPNRNFTRLIFMVFTIFCLIIRTAYQSKMYDFLQYDERQPTLRTISEVLQNNVSLGSWSVELNDELKKELNMPSEIPEVSIRGIDRLAKSDAGEKGEHAIIVNRANYKCFINNLNLRRENNKYFDEAFRITDDDLVSGLNTWYICMYSVVHNSLNKFLLECLQHGIINHLKSIYGWNSNVPGEENAKVLTMYILSAGFYVWLASIGIACIAFVLEHIHKRVTQQ